MSKKAGGFQEQFHQWSKGKRLVIIDERLANLQRRWVLGLNAVSLIGCAIAILQVFIGEVVCSDILLLLIMYILAVIGITVGYHRYLAHKAFQTHMITRIVLVVLGAMAGQGPPIYWVANHRRHHQNSDQPGDPHSPHVYPLTHESSVPNGFSGFLHAHLGWLLKGEITNPLFFAKDLLLDPVICWVNRWYLLWLLLGLIIPGILGAVVSHTWIGAFSGFVWGGLVRLFFSIQGGYIINSVTHLYGSRSFETNDLSTNNLWLSIATLGESWHNNHHAFPYSAKFGINWWQIDVGYLIIKSLSYLGLAWDIKTPIASQSYLKASD